MKVLIADDSGVMRKIVRRAVEGAGLSDIVDAADGQQALELFNQQSFDLVLTDWNMPEKNGIELLRDIRSQGSQVPVILITTEAEKNRVVEAVEAGVSDYLTKPFEKQALVQKIEKQLASIAQR